MQTNKWNTEFVQTIPNQLKEKTFYVCLRCDVVIHLCACGCKNRVVTPIDKVNGWKFEYDGYGISLSPSIGNFSFPCCSHYYVKNGKIVWINENNKKTIFSGLLSKIKSCVYKF